MSPSRRPRRSEFLKGRYGFSLNTEPVPLESESGRSRRGAAPPHCPPQLRTIASLAAARRARARAGLKLQAGGQCCRRQWSARLGPPSGRVPASRGRAGRRQVGRRVICAMGPRACRTRLGWPGRVSCARVRVAPARRAAYRLLPNSEPD